MPGRSTDWQRVPTEGKRAFVAVPNHEARSTGADDARRNCVAAIGLCAVITVSWTAQRVGAAATPTVWCRYYRRGGIRHYRDVVGVLAPTDGIRQVVSGTVLARRGGRISCLWTPVGRRDHPGQCTCLCLLSSRPGRVDRRERLCCAVRLPAYRPLGQHHRQTGASARHRIRGTPPASRWCGVAGQDVGAATCGAGGGLPGGRRRTI